MLFALLVVVVALTACIEGDDPDTTAPAPPPGEEFGGVPTDSAGGNTLTPAIDPCGEAVPAAIVEPGTRQTVIGDVVNVRKAAGPHEPLTLLEFGEEGGDVPFAIAIPDRVLDEFAQPPAELYAGVEVCVNGVVQEFEGIPVIFIAGDGEIVTTGE